MLIVRQAERKLRISVWVSLLQCVFLGVWLKAAVIRGGEAAFDLTVFADVEGENEFGTIRCHGFVIRPCFIDFAVVDALTGAQGGQLLEFSGCQGEFIHVVAFFDFIEITSERLLSGCGEDLLESLGAAALSKGEFFLQLLGGLVFINRAEVNAVAGVSGRHAEERGQAEHGVRPYLWIAEPKFA
jgi:hypothetical protein